MSSTRSTRLPLSKVAPGLVGIALLVSASWLGNSVVVSPVEADTIAFYDVPTARAATLGLPFPTYRTDAEHPECAADLEGQYPKACFTDRDDVDDYIAGRSRQVRTTQVTLSGFGGTSAALTGNPAVGRTCTGSGCTGTTTTWYSTTGANCTHAYPNNDYFKENVSTFYYAMNLAAGVSRLNCNRMILYRDATQGGAGALDCGSTTATCGSGTISYQSISWHNG